MSEEHIEHDKEKPIENTGNSDGRNRAAEEQAEASPSPRIYVASLSDYNSGRLHGKWIDAAQDEEELHEAIQTMLKASPEPIAEEWAIHDYEGFGPAGLSEYEPLGTVSQLAEGIEKHGLAFAAFASLVGNEAEQLDRFDELYRGEWESAEAYADEFLNDIGATAILEGIPEWLQSYVSLDSAAFAWDMQLGGDIDVVEKPDGGVWVFEGNW